MKFSVDADELRVATSHARSNVARGHSAPVLANVYIEATKKGGKAMFRSTDVQVELEYTLDANVTVDGGTTVSAAVLDDLARRLPSGIAVEFDDQTKENPGKLEVRAGATKGTFSTLPKEDFPTFVHDDYDVKFMVESKALHRLFEMTKASVEPDSPRKYLQGVCFHVADRDDGKVLRGVSSDGFRLSRIDAKAPPKCEDMKQVIVPLKAVMEVIKMMGDAPEYTEISVSQNKVRFATPEINFTARAVSAEFPDYNKLIPESVNIRMDVDSELCQKALGRLGAVVSPNATAVLLDIKPDNLNLSVTSTSYGKIEEDIEVAFPHEPMQIKFNHGHLSNVFSLLKEGAVSIELQKTPGATVFTSDADQNALYVVMPIRV